MAARDHTRTLRGRDAAARAKGWRSYGQRRYWEARWSREVAEALGLEACGGHKEPERAGSILCRSCNAIVNPNAVTDNPPGAEWRGQESDWRARLVRLVEERRAQRRGAKLAV